MPTTVLDGTNIKVLVAMAIGRAVVSASSGSAGLGLTHGHNVWIADTPEAFASSVAAHITDALRRQALAEAACARRTSFRLANFRRETAPAGYVVSYKPSCCDWREK